MLVSLLIFAAVVSALAVCGISINTLLNRKNTIANAIWAQLLGMTFLLSTMAFGLNFAMSTGQIFFAQSAIFFSLVLFFVVQKFRSKTLGTVFRAARRFKIEHAFLAIPSVVYAFLSQGKIFESSYTYRVGSDLFGWSTTATTLCRTDTLGTLTQRVQSQLGSTDLLQSFQSTLPAGTNSIQQINSYNDLISIVFLTGAHRTGGPGLMAGICGVLGDNQFAAIYTALLTWAIFVITLICFHTAKTFGANKWNAVLLATAIPLTASSLSVSLEGGFGQLLTLPYLLFAAATLIYKKFSFKDFSGSLLMMIVAASATYFDLLFLGLPLILGVFALQLLFRKVKLKKTDFKPFIWQLGIALLATFYFVPDALRLIAALFASPTLGGWDQGRIPLPINIFGMLPWLPTGDKLVSARTGLDWGLEISLTIVLLAFIALTYKSKSIGLTLLVMLAYGYLFASVYEIQPFNNYRLWKFGMYASTLIVFALASALRAKEQDLAEPQVSRAATKIITGVKRWLAVLLICLSLVTTTIWSIDWVASRKIQMSTEERQKFIEAIDGRDVIFDASYGQLLPLEVTVYADVHYVYPVRFAEKPTWRSAPDRDLVIIRPNGLGCTVADAEAMAAQPVASVDVVGGNGEFTVYKVNLK